VFIEDVFRAGEALTAAGGHTKGATQLFHRGDAKFHGLTDFAIGDVVANTNNH
jgi:hypothetical protein